MGAIAIIQARMGSTRLSGKVLMKVDERNPVLYYVINQLQYSKLLDKVIVATTTLKEDDEIGEFVNGMGIDCFRGDALNVLDRYYQCAKKFSVPTIVRITSDNPLIDPLIVDQVIKKFNSGLYDYVTNTQPRTFPQGTEVEVFSFQALERAWTEAKKPSEREHVTPYFYNPPTKFKIFNVLYLKDISHLRWTVDKQSDLDLVRIIASKIKKRPILMTDIIDLLSKEPHLVK
ncbi:MAG: cytidylyltransferase domain-containing protein [Nitrosopumilaceae archaeon]